MLFLLCKALLDHWELALYKYCILLLYYYYVAASFMDYLVKTGLLYELQSAFRVGFSTESALISLTDQILFNLDEDKLSGMVFVDFRKAFDVVDHQLLLTKLRLYRVSDP